MGQMAFLSPNQQCQSTEGNTKHWHQPRKNVFSGFTNGIRTEAFWRKWITGTDPHRSETLPVVSTKLSKGTVWVSTVNS